MRSRQLLVLVVVTCGVMALSAVASASIIQTNAIQTAQFSMPSLASGEANLVENGGGYVTSSTWTAGAGKPMSWGLSPSGMTDGSLPATDQPTSAGIMALDGADGTNSAVPYSIYFLDTATHAAGYSVTAIDLFAGWTGNRVWQAMEVKYNLVGETYTSGELSHTLGSYLYHPTTTGYKNTRMALTDSTGTLVSGISAIEIKYVSNGFTGSTVAPYLYNMTSYTQLAVIGAPTPTPEPSSIVLLVSALLGMVAYAWRKRR